MPRRHDIEAYDPADEPADLIPLTVNVIPRYERVLAALALRAELGDLEACELEDLS